MEQLDAWPEDEGKAKATALWNDPLSSLCVCVCDEGAVLGRAAVFLAAAPNSAVRASTPSCPPRGLILSLAPLRNRWIIVGCFCTL